MDATWRAALAALWFLAAGACTRANADYCDAAQICTGGLVCNLATHACEEPADCEGEACLCGDHEACAAATPQCSAAGECVACVDGADGDAACLAHPGGTARCLAGACVECVASADCAAAIDQPHCGTVGDGANACGPCARDEECASGVCSEGKRCVAADEIIHVASGGADGGACDAAAPCATVAGGLAELSAARGTVMVHAGPAPYAELIVLDAAAIAAAGVTEFHLVGAPGERPIFAPGAASPALSASGGTAASLAVERLELRGGAAEGVRCRGASLALTDVAVHNFAELGVDAADDCNLELRRSDVRENARGGVSLTAGTTFVLENDVIAQNGVAVGAARGGVSIEDAIGSVRFTTVADNRVDSGGRSPGLDCLGVMTLGNNIVTGNRRSDSATPDNVGGDCLHASSLLGAAIDPDLDGGGNLIGTPDFAADDSYRIGLGSLALDVASAVDVPELDIDGDARPSGAGYDMGADERAP